MTLKIDLSLKMTEKINLIPFFLDDDINKIYIYMYM